MASRNQKKHNFRHLTKLSEMKHSFSLTESMLILSFEYLLQQELMP